MGMLVEYQRERFDKTKDVIYMDVQLSPEALPDVTFRAIKLGN